MYSGTAEWSCHKVASTQAKGLSIQRARQLVRLSAAPQVVAVARSMRPQDVAQLRGELCPDSPQPKMFAATRGLRYHAFCVQVRGLAQGQATAGTMDWTHRVYSNLRFSHVEVRRINGISGLGSSAASGNYQFQGAVKPCRGRSQICASFSLLARTSKAASWPE